MNRPDADPIFESGLSNKYDIAPQSAEAAAATLSRQMGRLVEALGGGTMTPANLEHVGTVTVAGGDPIDIAAVGDTGDLRTTYEALRCGDLSVFRISGRHLRGTSVRGRHERLLVQRGGVSVCEVMVSTSPRRRILGNDPVEVDQAHVRMTPGLDTVLGGPLTEIVGALRLPPSSEHVADDLEGVNLGGGRPVALGPTRSAIEWTLRSTAAPVVQDLLLGYVQRCFTEFALGPVPSLVTSTTRTWNCLEGAQSPDCPYSDLTRRAGSSEDGRVHISLSTVQAHWADDDIDHVSVTLDMRTAIDRLRVVATGQSGNDACTTLRLIRPTSGAAVEALWQLFGGCLVVP